MSNFTTYNLSVEASTEHLGEVRDFIAEHAAAFGFNQQEIADIKLAVDEAYTNIIKHAYKDHDEKNVSIELGYNSEEFWVKLLDTGTPFDPKNYSFPNIRKQIKNKKRGGVGVYLIQKLMDEVNYQSDGEVNQIRMIKRK